MTSVLNVDTIADKAGTGPVGLTKQIATKAYAHYDHANTNVDGSFNISSVADTCLLYTSPSPRDRTRSRMPSSA